VLTYDRKVDINPAAKCARLFEQLVKREKIDFMHFIKYGHDDHITRRIAVGHSLRFIMAQPHGDVYAGVSATLAKKFGQQLQVPHIINPSRRCRHAEETRAAGERVRRRTTRRFSNL